MSNTRVPTDAPFADEPTVPRDTPATDTREDLDRILEAARSVEDPTPLLAMLADKAPVALAEVCCGARAPGGPIWVRAALIHAAILERQLTPRGAWGRLVELAGDAADPEGAAMASLRLASARHPAASWLLKLSRKVEGPRAGATHLAAAASHPGFAQACVAHAEAGHVEGLLAGAASTGRAEPAAALVALDPVLGVRAAALALDTDPTAAVVAHLSAVWGPEPDRLVAKVVPHLSRRLAAVGLLEQARHLPHTTRLLRAVIPGMAR